MPTGYTYEISKGISFDKFVLNCARAFGALITMRDDPMDAEIPDEFIPSDYHAKAIEETKKKVAYAESLTLEQAGEEATKQYKEELAAYKKRIEEAHTLKMKYQDMLRQVENWQPPTPDHRELKDFMVEQITSSIDFDCSTEHLTPPILLAPEKWITKTINEYLWSLAYHTDELDKEISRCASRTKWVKALKRSLDGSK